jgi:hypothetical protein
MIDSRRPFLAAADAYVAQVARIPLDALTGPGLGEWDLRALVGHASRSLVTVDTYLEQPTTEAAVPTAAAYYAAIAAAGGPGGPEIVERGRAAGAALGDDPAAYVAALFRRVRDKVNDVDPSFLLTTIVGGMRLEEYLRTRTFELVVHGLDIDRACGVSAPFDLSAMVDATTLAAEIATATGLGREVLLGLTGRAPLPAGFSVV